MEVVSVMEEEAKSWGRKRIPEKDVGTLLGNLSYLNLMIPHLKEEVKNLRASLDEKCEMLVGLEEERLKILVTTTPKTVVPTGMSGRGKLKRIREFEAKWRGKGRKQIEEEIERREEELRNRSSGVEEAEEV